MTADDEATQSVMATIEAAQKRLADAPNVETVIAVLRMTLRILRFLAKRAGLADEPLD